MADAGDSTNSSSHHDESPSPDQLSRWELHPPTTEEELREALQTINYRDFDSRERLHDIYMSHFVEPLLVNAETAVHKATEKSNLEFADFPRLPPELRIKIWQYALAVSYIVELQAVEHEAREASNVSKVSFENRSPPSLLSTCVESRQQALKAYADSNGNLLNPHWLRPSQDIFHLKPFVCSLRSNGYFSQRLLKSGWNYERPDWQHGHIQQWDKLDYGLLLGSMDDTDKWQGRPLMFEKAKTLAVNCEFLILLKDDFECFFRHFFPHLISLIILFDDTNLEYFWARQRQSHPSDIPLNHTFKAFAPGRDGFQLEFARRSTGPFTRSMKNSQAVEYFKFIVQWRLAHEAGWQEGYHPPQVIMMGASLP